MVDLTTEYAWACTTNEHWQIEVRGSKSDTYTIKWQRNYSPDRYTEFHYTCTCKGFEFRSHCKHVKQVQSENKRCGWNERFDAETYDGAGCPRCREPVFAFSYGA